VNSIDAIIAEKPLASDPGHGIAWLSTDPNRTVALGFAVIFIMALIMLSLFGISLTFLANDNNSQAKTRVFFGPSYIFPIYSLVLLRYLI
jgi:hypothetical protein